MNQKMIGRGTLILSLGLHALVLSRTSGVKAERAKEERFASLVEFTVPPLPEPEPELEPAPEPEVEALPVPTPPKIETEPTTEEAPSEDAPADESPIEEASTEEAPEGEISGHTLLADGEGSFGAPAGSGSERKGSFRTPAKKVVIRRTRQTKRTLVQKAPPPPTVVAITDLKQRPAPPALGNALKRNYPSDARQQGRSGEAKIKARIERDGRIQLANIALETSAGFGQACRKTLLESTWSAPLDKRGEAVATWITYRCKFRIDD